MKILSFDVGIKNLAFCIIDEEEKILRWENINLNEYGRKDKQVSLICELDKRPFLLESIFINRETTKI